MKNAEESEAPPTVTTPKWVTSVTVTIITKQKRHAGNIGIEHADALAWKSLITYSDVADTSIKTAGPAKGNPFYGIYWLAKEYKVYKGRPSIKACDC